MATPIDFLPNEILMKIYIYLKDFDDKANFEGVCSKWRKAALAIWRGRTSLVFYDLVLSLGDQTTKYETEPPTIDYDILLENTLRKGCYSLTKVDLTGSEGNLTPKSLACIGEICTELRYLDLSDTMVNNAAMEAITSGCRKIEVIIAQGCLKLTEDGVRSLFVNCKNLVYVDLYWNERMTGKCFSELNPGCRAVSVMGCQKLANKAIDILAMRCPNLEMLNFGFCRRIMNRRIPDMNIDRWVELNKLTEKCQKLKVLHACGGRGQESVPPDELLDLMNTQNLQVLCLIGLSKLNDEHLDGISNSCPALRELNLSATMSMGYAVTGEGLTYLSRLPHLEILILNGLMDLTNDGLESIGKRGVLRVLLIRQARSCSDEGFYHVATNCAQLKILDVCYTTAVSSATVQAFKEARAIRDDERKSQTLQIYACDSGINEDDMQGVDLQGTGIEVYMDKVFGEEDGTQNPQPAHHEITPEMLNSNNILSF